MGQKLIEYYKIAAEARGFEGKIELAHRTKIPPAKAAVAPDSAENLKRFETAMEKIVGERTLK